MSRALDERVETLRKDFEAETGKAFLHFHCPILRIDEPANLCEGHILVKSLGTSDVWLPQRSDVDSFYGWATEADFAVAVKGRGKNPIEKLTVQRGIR